MSAGDRQQSDGYGRRQAAILNSAQVTDIHNQTIGPTVTGTMGSVAMQTIFSGGFVAVLVWWEGEAGTRVRRPWGEGRLGGKG